MPELKSIVINTGPLIASVAATGSLDIPNWKRKYCLIEMGDQVLKLLI